MEATDSLTPGCLQRERPGVGHPARNGIGAAGTGSGFCFVARQKAHERRQRDDFYLDLLFYHRHLRRLVAVELKLESFQPAHTGQMELYLRWLDKHERAPGEEAPVASSCAPADAGQVELLQLDEKSIHVAEYPDRTAASQCVHGNGCIAQLRMPVSG
ncbi:PDDEXK nuclease domain-containing protein [Ferrovum myxofaciens]|uniref:PDDEXK nuclease domain-containing protein n=1 Tax=Ferrovum myxofaciens TaxID=416213 RepID=UPI002354D075|nr:PDDEXK nuclease domain-containing protein [Ferrovum myxofaciens]